MNGSQREHIGNMLFAALVTFMCGLLAASFLWYCCRTGSPTAAASVASAAG